MQNGPRRPNPAALAVVGAGAAAFAAAFAAALLPAPPPAAIGRQPRPLPMRGPAPQPSRKRKAFEYEGFAAYTPIKKRKIDETLVAQREFEEKLIPMLKHALKKEDFLEVLPILFLNARPDFDLQRHPAGESYHFIRMAALLDAMRDDSNSISLEDFEKYLNAFIEMSSQDKVDWNDIGSRGSFKETVLSLTLGTLLECHTWGLLQNPKLKLFIDSILKHLGSLLVHKELNWNYVFEDQLGRIWTPCLSLMKFSVYSNLPEAWDCLKNLIDHRIAQLEFSFEAGVFENDVQAKINFWISLAWLKWMIAEKEPQAEIDAYLSGFVYPAARAAMLKGYFDAGILLAEFFEQMGKDELLEVWLKEIVRNYPLGGYRAHFMLGRFYIQKGKLELAEQYFKQIEPTSSLYATAIYEIVNARMFTMSLHVKKVDCKTPEDTALRKETNAKREQDLLSLFELALTVPGELGDSIRTNVAHQYIKKGQDGNMDPLAVMDFKGADPVFCLTYLRTCKEKEQLKRKAEKLKSPGDRSVVASGSRL